MLAPHLRTITPRVLHALRRPGTEEGEEWSAEVPDDRWGAVRIGGRWHEHPEARDAFVLIHGLGGCRSSHYMPAASRAVREAGASCLHLEMRGSDLQGEDLYHAALVADVAAAVASPELSRYERIFLIGFSLGGHLGLRYAVETPDERLRGVAAICAPLDLAAAQAGFDRPACWLYRRYVLQRLKRLYRPIASRRDLATPLAEVMRATTIREWDRLTVVPRFGFRDVDHYYEEASVGPKLADLRVPGLLVGATRDPMVPKASVEAALSEGGGALEAVWVHEAGHVGFPPRLDLGFGGEPGLERQVVGRLLEKSRPNPPAQAAGRAT